MRAHTHRPQVHTFLYKFKVGSGSLYFFKRLHSDVDAYPRLRAITLATLISAEWPGDQIAGHPYDEQFRSVPLRV